MSSEEAGVFGALLILLVIGIACIVGAVDAVIDDQADWTWRCKQAVTPERTVSWDCQWVR